MAQDIAIRAPTPAEFSAVIDLRNVMLNRPNDYEEETGLSETDLMPDTVHVAAFRAGELVGTLYLRPAWGAPDTLVVQSVATKYHHEGIGSLLLRHAEVMAIEKGARKLRLVAMNDSVARFYAGLGYVVTDRNEGSRCGPSMAKDLING